MNLAKIDTAISFVVGPILDADGVAKTDEVVASIKVTKNGSVGAPNGSSTLTHNHTGHYVYAANAGDIDTLGVLTFSLNSGTNAMAPVSFMVVTANVWDSLCSTDVLQADLTQIGGVAQSATDLKDFADTGYDPSTHRALSDLKAILATELTETSGGYLAAAFKKLFDVATPLLVASAAMRGTDGANTTVPDAAGVVASALGDLQTHGDSTWATATGFATAANVADAVWEEAVADHSGTAGSTAEALAAAGSAGDPWITPLPGAYAEGSAGYIIGTNLDMVLSDGVSITVGPLVASYTPANLVGSPLELQAFQHGLETFTLEVLDSDDAAVDLSAKTLRFIIETTAPTPIAKLTIEAASIAVSGDDNEIATVTVAAGLLTFPAGTYNWRLWDTTADEVLVYGTFVLLSSTDGG